MKIVVIGGTGLTGAKLVRALAGRGHEAVAASPSTGVNTVTGEGLREALRDASVVVDVTNPPSYEEEAARQFFITSAENTSAAEADAGVRHHVALSVVGTERLATQSGYFRGKLAQEKHIADGPTPFTIVRATQFFEFLPTIADSATDGDTVRLPDVLFQPMAVADVAEGLANVALADPANGIVEFGGPEAVRLPDLVRTALTASGDGRTVIADPAARYWGVDIDERTLVPGAGAWTSECRYEDWVLETAEAE